MSTVPFSSFAAPRIQHSLSRQNSKDARPSKIPCERLGDMDPCSPLLSAGLSETHARPQMATYFIKNDQMFSQTIRTNPDGSTSISAVPVNNVSNLCSPGLLIRSDKFDPTSVKQPELKPVSSKTSPGVGPRKG